MPVILSLCHLGWAIEHDGPHEHVRVAIRLQRRGHGRLGAICPHELLAVVAPDLNSVVQCVARQHHRHDADRHEVSRLLLLGETSSLEHCGLTLLHEVADLIVAAKVGRYRGDVH